MVALLSDGKRARDGGAPVAAMLVVSMGTTAARTTEPLDTRPLIGDFGVEITGIDFRAADREALDDVATALAYHGAILLRGQRLNPDEQVDFTSVFGEPADN